MNKTLEIKQYSIVIANLPENGKHIQAKKRPVIIISNNICNKYSPVITIIPITSKSKKDLPTHYKLIKSEMQGGGGTVLGEQLISLDKKDISKYICSLNNEQITNIKEIIKKQLNI